MNQSKHFVSNCHFQFSMCAIVTVCRTCPYVCVIVQHVQPIVVSCALASVDSSDSSTVHWLNLLFLFFIHSFNRLFRLALLDQTELHDSCMLIHKAELPAASRRLIESTLTFFFIHDHSPLFSHSIPFWPNIS